MADGGVWHLRGKDGESLVTKGVEINSDCLDRFIRGIKILDNASCWEWTRNTDEWGYGRMWFRDTASHEYKRCNVRIHRISWIMANQSSIPDGQLILHSCDNPKCGNPYHLRIGTAKDNMQDAMSRCRLDHNLFGRSWKSTRGERNYNSKLTENDVRKIRAEYSTGDVSQAELARAYGLSKQTICNVVRGHAWKFVT